MNKKNNLKKLLYLYFVLVCIFSMSSIFASGDSEDSGDDSSDSDSDYEYNYNEDEEYDYGYGEEQEAYHEAAGDICDGNGDNYTTDELIDMQQDAEDNGDYAIADLLGDYADSREDDEDDSSSSLYLLTKGDLEDYIDKVHDGYVKYTEDPELDVIEAAFLIEQLGGAEFAEEVNEMYWGSYVIGDPVMIVSGSYSYDEVDIENVNGFEIFSRKYRQSTNEITLLGNKWISNLDTRLIFGFVDISDETISSLEKNKEEMENNYEELKNIIENNDCEDEVYEIFNELTNELNEVKENFNNALNLKRKNDRNIERNRYTFYKGMDREKYYMSYENIICIDDGIPYVFFPNEENSYNTKLSNKYKLMMIKEDNFFSFIGQIISGIFNQEKNELEKQNEDYFMLENKIGIKKYFNYYGLLTSVTVPGGEGYRISRNENGRIISLMDTHNRNFIFEFENNVITKISDQFGNVYSYDYEKINDEILLASRKNKDKGNVKYEYNNDAYLNKIYQPDNKYVEINYKNYLKDGENIKCVESVKDVDGNIEYFNYDFGNKITKHINRDGIETTLKYDSNYKLIEKKIENNYSQKYNYSEGKLINFSEYGFEVNYEYDDNGNVISLSDSYNKIEKYKYDSKNRICEKTDSDGVIEKINYDNFGNCISRKINNMEVYEARYDENNGYKIYERIKNLEKYYFYDENNYLSEVKILKDGNYETFEKYFVDDIGRVVEKVFPDGTDVKIQYKEKEIIKTFSNGLQEIFKYNICDELEELIEIDLITNSKRTTKYEYNGKHKITKIIYQDKNKNFIYSPEGLLKKIETCDENEKWIEEYKYDSNGRMIECKKNKFNIKLNSFDSDEIIENYIYKEDYLFFEIEKYINKNFIESRKFYRNGFDFQWENGCGEVFEKNYSTAGRLLDEVTKYGGVKSRTYDSYGNIKTVKMNENLIEKYSYNIYGDVSEITDGNYNTTKYFYDELGNVIKIIAGGCIIEYEYDLASRLVGIFYGGKKNPERFICFEYSKTNREVVVNEGDLYKTKIVLNSWGNIVEVVNGENDSVKREYDSNGNLKNIIDGYGNITSYKYNSLNLVSEIIFPDGRVLKYKYDVLGKLIKILCNDTIFWEGKNNINGKLDWEKNLGDVKKEYKYDAAGNILERKKGNVVESSYVYDNYGKNISIFDGMGNEYKYEKNINGNIVKEINRLNNVKFYEYDNKNMLINEKDFNGNEIKINYDYDNLILNYKFDDDNITHKYNMSEKIISIKNEIGEIRYEYNKAGKLISVFDVEADEKIYYRYDRAGRLVSVISFDRFVMYEYGKNNEIKKIYDEKQDLLIELKYDNCGREIMRSFGNGISLETVYDALGRVSGIIEKNPLGITLWSETYIYNSEGKIEKIIDLNENIISYKYDSVGRIVEVNYSNELDNWFEKFYYDNNGNRIKELNPLEEILYEYDSENRMIVKGDTIFLYDKNNNLLEKRSSNKSEKYFYNSLNFLTNYVLLNEKNNSYDSVNYFYDGFGRRTIVQENDRTSMRTVYNGLTMETFLERTMLSNGNLSPRDLELISNVTNDEEVSRYKFLGVETDTKNKNIRNKKLNENYFSHFSGKRFYLYYLGNPVAVNKQSSNVWKENINILMEDRVSSENLTKELDGRNYFTTDIRDSVRNITDENGNMYCGFDYRAFGTPYLRNETHNLDYENNIICKIILESIGIGYGGQKIDNVTNHISYGYRDYDFSSGRFVTSDPVRDGSNWYALANNDPINFMDLLGFCCQDTLDEFGKKPDIPFANYPLMPDMDLFIQNMFSYSFGEKFASEACALTSLINGLVVAHYNDCREEIAFIDVISAVYAAINNDSVRSNDAYITDWVKAGETIAEHLGIDVNISYNSNHHEGDITIFAIDKNDDGIPDHFVLDVGNNYYFDPYDGTLKYMDDDLYATVGNGGTRDLNIN